MNDRFQIRCWAGMYGDQWLVVRTEDRRIMASGGVTDCLRWMDVWAPVQGNKAGTPLSPKCVL